MAWQPNIPLGSDKFSKSQADINGNFTILGSNLFTGTNIGMPAIAAPVSLASSIQIFAETSPFTTQPELAIQRQTGTASPTAYEFTSAGYSGNGWTRLPSGILMKWGVGSATGSATITFPAGVTIPAFTAIYNVIIIPASGVPAPIVDTNTIIIPGALTTTGFSVWAGTRNVPSVATAVGYFYTAIGI